LLQTPARPSFAQSSQGSDWRLSVNSFHWGKGQEETLLPKDGTLNLTPLHASFQADGLTIVLYSNLYTLNPSLWAKIPILKGNDISCGIDTIGKFPKISFFPFCAISLGGGKVAFAKI